VPAADSRPSSLAGSPVARPAIGIPVAAGLLLVFGGGFWLLLRAALSHPEIWQVLFTGLLLALLFGLPAMVLLVYLDRREPEPWWLLLLAFLWGLVVSTVLAVVLEEAAIARLAGLFNDEAALVDTSQLGYQFANPSELFAWLETSFIAPLIEEGVKALALILIFLLLPTEANSMRDGIVYGGLVGLGFAVVESVVFIVSGYTATGEPSYLSQLIPRFVLFGVNGHALFTALFGAGLGLARQSVDFGWFRRALLIVGGFLLALAAHTMFNAYGPFALSAFASVTGAGPTVTVAQLWILQLAAVIATYGWAYVIISALATRSGYWELGVCQAELAEERSPTITPEEQGLVAAEGLWRLRRVPGLPRRQSARLVRAQNELAFRRHDVRGAGADPDSDPLVEEWRAAIADLREGVV
jgi:RsiW-degrading membrane proteinase PrsW (M82 family)